MNCRASQTSDKSDDRQVAGDSYFNWNLRLFAFDKNLSLHLPYIKYTKHDKDSGIRLNVFKEMVNEFRTNNMAWRLFMEDYFFKTFHSFSYII